MMIRPHREKFRKIILHKDIIFHDIDALTYKLAESAVEGTSRDKVSSDSEDSIDAGVLTAFMNNREANLRKKLTFCLRRELVAVVDNTPDLKDDYVYEFHLPERFDDATLKVAAQLMHDYLVRASLFDWYNSIGSTFGASIAPELSPLESRIVDIFRVPEFVHSREGVIFHNYKIR